MAKSGLNGKTVGALLTEAARRTGWSLCVGAGISRPVFPDWGGLVDSLLSRAGPIGITRKIAPLDAFSADALIEASRDVLGLPPERFSDILSEELYAPLRKRLAANEWDCLSRVLNSKAPGDCPPPVWTEFAKLRAKQLNGTSSAAIARVVAPLIGKSKSPREILCFNVEPLLYALLTHETFRRKRRNATQRLDPITRSISHREVGRLPFVYCHGLLPVPTTGQHSGRSSLDKLVFSEGQYLELSSHVYSFQSATFLDAAAHRRMLFVGVSLADPNMRRWLSWVRSIRIAEIERTQKAGAPLPATLKESTPHLWVNERPAAAVARWVEASVAHLGVRLVWIDAWSQVADVLRRLLA